MSKPPAAPASKAPAGSGEPQRSREEKTPFEPATPPARVEAAPERAESSDDLLPPGSDPEADDAEELLPPPASEPAGSDPEAGSKRATPADSAADQWLPPAADEDELPPGSTAPTEQVALPQSAALAAAPTRRKTADGSPLFVAEDGREIALREPVKTVGKGVHERELRQLTPDEKIARRRRKNLITWSVGFLAMIVMLWFLLR